MTKHNPTRPPSQNEGEHQTKAPKDNSPIQAERENDRVYLAALRTTVAIVPITVALVTVGAYFAFERMGAHAVTIGASVALLTWLVVALFTRNCVTPNSADSRNYHLIREKLDRLENRTKCLCEESQNMANTNGKESINNVGINGTTRTIVCKQVLQECREIRRILNSVGMPWATRLGYIELLRRIHRAEEGLIKVQPTIEVLGGAMRDELRLSDSNMTNRESLLKRLRSAVAVLDSTEIDENLSYVEKPEGKLGNPTRSDNERQKQDIHEKAINILSEIRYEINYFRDKGSEGIIHARIRLSATSVALGSVTYVLLALSIFADAPPKAILAATAYFLVGALTGLFARSQAEWTADTAVGDFGLSSARLLHVPWLSGLAAVAGVLVTSVADNQFMSHGLNDRSLTAIFDFTPSLFIVAAVFGLTPDLLIRRLTQQAEIYKGDLQSTETSQSTERTQTIQASERT
jgi:hypothetical protein